MPRINQDKMEIEQASANAVKIIADAAGEASRLLASMASDAAKVVANAASEAVKVSNIKGADDHDLLIKLETKMDSLKEDIKDIKDGTSRHISDHEQRIQIIEGKVSKFLITISLYSIAVAGLIGLVVYLITK